MSGYGMNWEKASLPSLHSRNRQERALVSGLAKRKANVTANLVGNARERAIQTWFAELTPEMKAKIVSGEVDEEQLMAFFENPTDGKRRIVRREEANLIIHFVFEEFEEKAREVAKNCGKVQGNIAEALEGNL